VLFLEQALSGHSEYRGHLEKNNLVPVKPEGKYESYVGNLYRQGKVTLRDAATLLNLNQIETLDLFLDTGISGNLDATDVLTSLHSLDKYPS
jgi:hypothetical protein